MRIDAEAPILQGNRLGCSDGTKIARARPLGESEVSPAFLSALCLTDIVLVAGHHEVLVLWLDDKHCNRYARTEFNC